MSKATCAKLTEANCTARKLLLKKFPQFAADFIFSDEKVFTVALAVKNSENRLKFNRVKTNNI